MENKDRTTKKYSFKKEKKISLLKKMLNDIAYICLRLY